MLSGGGGVPWIHLRVQAWSHFLVSQNFEDECKNPDAFKRVRGPSHKYPLNGLKVALCYPKTSYMKQTTFILSFSIPEILS